MMKKCLLPKIRFPAFVKDGEWKKVCLEDCLVQKLEYGVNKAAVSYSSDLPTYLRITDITDDGTFANENKVSVDVEVTQKNSLKEGDIVLARTGASVGKAYKYRIEDGPLVYAGFLIRVRPDAKKLKSDYLFQYLFSNDYKKWVASKCLRCAQPGINAAEYSSLEIPCPPTIEEQKKIADLLSSVDAKVSATQEKLEELREQKIGMLQKLFPRNGKNIPDYRFPEFKNDGEWQNGCLGDFASFFKGKGISKSEVSDDGNIPCIRYGELYTRYHEMVKDVKSHTVLSPENLFFSQKNDVIIPATGETAEDISTASYLPQDGIALGGDINVVRSNCDGLFLAYYLSHIKKNDIAKIAHGFAIVHLHAEKLSKLKVQIPSLPEQKKIAQAILSVDELISLYMEKKDQLIQYKKGLMQRLFA